MDTKHTAGRRTFLTQSGAALAALMAAASGLGVGRVSAQSDWSQTIVRFREWRDYIEEIRQLLPDIPVYLLQVSKNVEGIVITDQYDTQTCPELSTRTWQVSHAFDLRLTSNGSACDADELDAVAGLTADLMASFREDLDGPGYHLGTFDWSLGRAGTFAGVMSGTTNSNTHRQVNSKECLVLGHMQGRIDGVYEGTRAQFLESRLCCTYAFDVAPMGIGQGRLQGTLDGVLILPCP